MLWTQLVDALRAVIFAVAHGCNGSLGLAVCLVSLVLRLALLPLSVRLSVRALAQQRRMQELKPELELLRARHAGDPGTLMRKTTALYRSRGVKPIDPAGLLGSLIQLPILGALFSALRRGVGAGVRFLWISDLGRSDLKATILVTMLTVAGVAAIPSIEPARRLPWLPILLTAGTTIWILASTSALFALATGAGSLVSLLQAALVRRAVHVAPAE
jgi:YidC/Oxa1 family membrane protein insertase